jgi:hypothetical protein
LKFGENLPQNNNGDKDWDVKAQIDGPMGKQKCDSPCISSSHEEANTFPHVT